MRLYRAKVCVPLYGGKKHGRQTEIIRFVPLAIVAGRQNAREFDIMDIMEQVAEGLFNKEFLCKKLNGDNGFCYAANPSTFGEVQARI